MPEVRFLGLYAVIPTTILLTISFFVLVIANKVKENVLKSFGNVIAMLLWLAAAIVLATGIIAMSTTGYCPMLKIMKKGAMKGMYQHHMMSPKTK